MRKKIVAATAAVMVGASFVASPSVHAASSSYKVIKKQLVYKKNGKLVKGYVVYQGKLYKNGKLNKGYKKIGTGKSVKLYYNATLKKGYKKAKQKTMLFRNGVLAKGQVQTKDRQRLYVDGHLATGKLVYENLDGDVFLYSDGLLKKGLATAPYESLTLLFNDGVLAKGDRIYKKKLYIDGKPNVGLKYVDGLFYFQTDLANDEIDGVLYKDGQVVTTSDQAKVETAAQDVASKEEVVYETKTEYVEFNKITNNASGNTLPEVKPSALKTKSVLTLTAFIEKYKDKTLTEADKAEIERVRATYEAQAVQNLQNALADYEASLKQLAKVIAEATARENDTATVQAWQQLLLKQAETVVALHEEVATFKDVTFNGAEVTSALNEAVTATGGAPLPVIEVPNVPPDEGDDVLPPTTTPDEGNDVLPPATTPDEGNDVLPPATTPDEGDDVLPPTTTPDEGNDVLEPTDETEAVATSLAQLNEKLKAGTDVRADYEGAGITFIQVDDTFFTTVLQPALRQAAAEKALTYVDIMQLITTVTVGEN